MSEPEKTNDIVVEQASMPAHNIVEQASKPPEKKTIVFDETDMIRTTRLHERALRCGWNVPTEYREAIVNRLVMLALNDDPSKGRVAKDRERSIALKALVNICGQELQSIRTIWDMFGPKQEPGSGMQVNVQVNTPPALENASVEQLEKLKLLLDQMKAEAITKEAEKPAKQRRLPPPRKR